MRRLNLLRAWLIRRSGKASLNLCFELQDLRVTELLHKLLGLLKSNLMMPGHSRLWQILDQGKVLSQL